ncbi:MULTISPECIES: cytochrome d ubiquinol oxidase subunit II [Heyndrickxia]|jgi:cytochrome d ubiquinol oxidase subunit II|uniref:Cytochrome D ubiquinol oxidase subunit II n=1 Tax=Heyndrickxia oleronia TaxID=38875 RepID=A0A8E2I6W1_9BACI|nr:cytochrome d ubiquinol oxidase subunit II [Heyndrickxia oleronia]NYV68328.1 cytochrome d ubiquinol oxidase subunit II [Bacillus sp. Gen3]OJH20493.1 cytochrome D ubiquinol oxidase subunit II [Bacillus obstructivus]MBU5210232.1 cytochrome d ubiquinol oxidase subunit II [Heyndrickxia oleronia]MCI1592143.1 cytochrome d ubiquinol oxidase subunit II [Heyndrickxia oleronia]MCI1615108.1 cytochrome d ubiquinol oxidase subunit II [Heyndrickxia oleronia]
MNLEILGISVLWLFLFGYVIIGSIDFGAGFFNAYSVLTGRQHILTHIIQRYLSPVWEITNVFLVFFFVGTVGFFPKTAFYYGTTLLVPASIGIILLSIRGSYYAFESYGSRGHKGYSFMYGVAGLLLPAALSVVLTISEGGFISLQNGQPVLDYWGLFTSPLTWSIVVLAIAAVLYISAVFLTWYANKANDVGATNLLRKYALIWAIPLVIAVIGIMVELRRHNPDHYARMVEVWYLFVISAIMFVITVWLIWQRKNYGMALTLLVGQFAFAFFAYGVSHYPFLLYPHLTLYDSFTNKAMAIALVIAFIAGFCLLIPSLYLVLKLFLFDKDYIRGKENGHV